MSEFNKIKKSIIYTSEYKKLRRERHHGINRYDHSIRVAKVTYKVSKKLNLDYKSATRAALLHDFFIDEDLKEENKMGKLSKHPILSAENAANYYNLNKLEEDAIKTHMFPLTKPSNTVEGLILSLSDKMVAIYEVFRFMVPVNISMSIILLINMITINNR